MAEANVLQEADQWWWLSFADDDGFLGVAVVTGFGLADAVSTAHRLGINPGGSVQIIELAPEYVPPESYRNRLLTKEEATSDAAQGRNG